MLTRYFTQTGSRIALLIGQVIVLIICIGYIEYYYFTKILPDKQAKEIYTEASCLLLDKKLTTKGRILRSYRADFLISYNAKGVQYNHWVSGNGLDYSFSRNITAQQNILAQYATGASYPCYYNPDHPEIVVFILRHHWLSTFPLIVPFIVGLITLYYFLKTIFQLVGAATIKTRQVIRDKKDHPHKKN